MMSRVDRERAIYVSKLAQIRQNLLSELPSAGAVGGNSVTAALQMRSIGDLAREQLLYDGMATDSLVE